MQNRNQLGKLATALEGIPVWGCLPGSVAARAGIRYGDVVMFVNGMRTKDIDGYMEARELRRDGAEVVIFRNGEELTIQLPFNTRAKLPDLSTVSQQLNDARLFPTDGTPQPVCDPN